MPIIHRLSVEEVEAVHAALRERFRAAGLGSVKDTEKALGLAHGHYSKARKNGRLDLGLLFATLRHLRVDLGDFFAGVFGDGGHPGDDSGASGAASPKKKTAAPAARARSKAPKLPGHDCREWLRQIDDLRYDDPEAAVVALWNQAEEVPEEHLARYFAVLASSYRMIGNLEYAGECLDWATERVGGDDDVAGDILQRRSYVVSYAGDFEAALAYAEQASGVYVRTGNGLRLGQSLVDQGRALLYLNRYAQVLAAVWAADPLVPRHYKRTRFAIAQYQMLVAREQGNSRDFLRFGEEARFLAPDSLAEGMVLNVLADSLVSQGRLEEAATKYAQEVEVLEAFPPNALLASLGLFTVLSKLGRSEEARGVAMSSARFMGTLKGSRVAEAALVEIYRGACEGAVRRATVDQLRSELRSALAKRRSDSVSDRVRRSRRLRGVPLAEAAAEAGVPAESLRRIESGVMPGTAYLSSLESWLNACRREVRRA